MNLQTFESYVATHTANLADEVKAEFTRFVDFVRGEEAQLKDALAVLARHGLMAVPAPKVEPSPVAPAESAAPSA